MVLGFLAVEGPGHVAAQACEVHGHRRDERNALVGRPEEHVEVDAAGLFGLKQRLGVVGAELIEEAAGVEETGIEEVGAHAARLGLEFAEAKDVGIEGEFDELGVIGSHDVRLTR